jgi:hypothetical protein
MIKQEISSKELLGEQIGSMAKDKINKLVYWILGIIIIGGLSNAYVLSRGIVRGWTKTRIQNVNL